MEDVMKKLLVAATLALSASAASAATLVGVFGAPDQGKAANQDYVVTFDAPNAAGYTWSGGIATATVSSGAAAQPAGNSDKFGYVSSAINPNTATLDTPDLQSISFYWGSIDDYNQLEVLDQFGNVILNIGGAFLPPANGGQTEQATNRRVFITAGANERISGLRLTSTGVAFEFDDFASNVPEPATWGMLIAGFGMVGAAARRRRMTSVTA
jgi:hypothetical protein